MINIIFEKCNYLYTHLDLYIFIDSPPKKKREKENKRIAYHKQRVISYKFAKEYQIYYH